MRANATGCGLAQPITRCQRPSIQHSNGLPQYDSTARTVAMPSGVACAGAITMSMLYSCSNCGSSASTTVLDSAGKVLAPLMALSCASRAAASTCAGNSRTNVRPSARSM